MGDRSEHEETHPPVSGGKAALWRRLGEHRVAQWTAAYVGLAYAIQHAVVLTGEAFEWPQFVQRVTMLLLILGMPLVVTVAWYHGERASRSFSTAEFSILSAILVVGAMLFYVFVEPSAEIRARPVTQEASVTAARSAATNPRTGIALAVLPFANLSDDKQQEFFSDGITEEITSVLAKIPDLSVVARTSAFQFKGQNRDAQTIGQQLHATHLIEGSVRKAGDRLRITAELVKSDTGVTVWTESYDRQLTDVFAIQEDIARSVANSLHMTLGLKPGARLVSNRIDDQTVHELYLRALAQLRARDVENNAGLDVLEQVIAKAPNFAPAWALLSQSLRVRLIGIGIGGLQEGAASVLKRAEEAANKAIELDPELADGYAALAGARGRQKDWAQAVELDRKALALDPNNPEVLQDYRNTLRYLGYLKEALRVSEQLTNIEPLVAAYTRITGEIERANGLSAGTATLSRAAAQFAAAAGSTTVSSARQMSFVAAAQAEDGNLAEAADTLSRGRVLPRGPFDASHVNAAVAALRAAASGRKSTEPLPAFNSELNFVYIYAGVPERMLEWQEGESDDSLNSLARLWWPMPSSLRKTERFKALVKKAGLVDYWRKNGWADRCHPTTGDDFACE